MVSARMMGRDETLNALTGTGQALSFGGLLASDAPLGFRGGDANLYRYFGNNPTGGIDPTGMADNFLTSLPGMLGGMVTSDQ